VRGWHDSDVWVVRALPSLIRDDLIRARSASQQRGMAPSLSVHLGSYGNLISVGFSGSRDVASVTLDTGDWQARF
jgi:hypothetical protein